MNTLCVGLDIAWFGGSAGNADSQHDCVAAVKISGTGNSPLIIVRNKLENRDPDADITFEAIKSIVSDDFQNYDRIVIAIDAPLQASGHPSLPQLRTPGGPVERRACENYFSAARQAIDKDAGRSAGWQPNIQSGAPLAPRVIKLLEKLSGIGFQVWSPNETDHQLIIIEAFPAEAIWAAKRQECYDPSLEASYIKGYKAKGLSGQRLVPEQVADMVHRVLDGFGRILSPTVKWEELVNQQISWLIQSGLDHGGKLLDDTVDTMICLATAISFANGNAHVWFDPANPTDGHIFGPGMSGPLAMHTEL